MIEFLRGNQAFLLGLAAVLASIGVTMLGALALIVWPERAAHAAERKKLIDRIAAVAGEQIHLRGHTAHPERQTTIRA